MSLKELYRLEEEETMLYRDIKTQYVDYKFKKVVVCSSCYDFLFPLLYDLYSGIVFGHDTVIQVTIFVEETKIKDLQVLYCNFILSGLPNFKDLKLSSQLNSFKDVDVIIIYVDIDWGCPEKPKKRIDGIWESFFLLRDIAMTIDELCKQKTIVYLIGDCLSSIRFLVGLYALRFPHKNIHAVTRQYECQAASLIASKLQLPMKQIKGIAVFGEDIVEVTNSWIEHDENDVEDDVYEESLMYYKSDIYELIKMNEKRKDIIEILTGKKNVGMIDIPDIDGLHFFELKEQASSIDIQGVEEEERDKPYYKEFPVEEGENAELLEDLVEGFSEENGNEELASFLTAASDIKVHQFQMGDEKKFIKKKWTSEDVEAWMNERFTDRKSAVVEPVEATKKPFSMSKNFQVSWARHWFAPIITGCHELPKEWLVDNCMTKDLHQKPPIRSTKWVMNRINDERFLMYTVPCKSKEVQNGYLRARAIVDFIKLLEEKSQKRTNEIVCSPGIYNVPPGIFFSFPVIINEDGSSSIIDGYDISGSTYLRIRNEVKFLEKEYEFIMGLFCAFPPTSQLESHLKPDFEYEIEEEHSLIDPFPNDAKSEEEKEVTEPSTAL